MKTIMIVDDSASVRQMVSLALRQAGYTTIEAADGQDALNKAAANTGINAVITDLNMPVMDGLTFIRQFRSRPQSTGVPIVFLSTESDEFMKSQAKQAGATGWMVKPFKAEQLVNVMRKVVGA